MIKIPVYNQKGKEIKKRDIPENIFGVLIKPGLVQEMVVAHAANSRVATAHTKTRAEISGGGKKPWKQKGTGRARHGSTRSPIWRKGGITFGPRSNRNYSKKVNTKAKRAALAMVLTDKVANKKLIILDAFTIEKPKTKEVAQALKAFPKLRSVLLVLAGEHANFVRASRNLQNISLSSPANLNVYDAVLGDGIMMTEPALDAVIKRLSPLKAAK